MSSWRPNGQVSARQLHRAQAEKCIGAVIKRNIGADNPEFGGYGARDVYVEEADLQRARELLTS